MAFNLRNLSVLAYANGFTLWHYKAETKSDPAIPGFLDEAADMLTAGDLMMVSARDGATMLCVLPSIEGAVFTAPMG